MLKLKKIYLALKTHDADKMNLEAEKFTKRMKEKIQRDLQEAAKEEVFVDIDESGPPSLCYSVIPTRLIKKFDAHEGEVHAVQWSHNGKLLATGGADRNVKVWEFNGKDIFPKFALTGCNMAITSITIDNDDQLLLASSNDTAARVWTLSDQRLRHTLTGHSDRVLMARFFNGNQSVVTGSRDHTLKIWDLKKNVCMKTVFCPSSTTDVIASDEAASSIISGHFDKKLRIWDMRNFSKTAREIALDGKITSLDLSRDRYNLLCCIRDDTLKIIDMRNNQVSRTFSHDDFRVGCDWTRARFSLDGTHVVVGGADGSLFIWNTLNGKLETQLKELSSSVICTSWSPAGDCIASSDRDRKVCIWGS